ncbi:hypothetical protein ACAW74_24475 [Fibrella sp. WM1]|uniref:hypothetical protein n=1 Tax=Fibrella musci TaxID=3242485 RepID=UPI00352244A5
MKTDSNLDKHWVYAIDPSIPFSRLSKPNLWAPNNSPQNKSSLQAEIYISNKLDFKGEDHYLERTLHSLKEMNIINDMNIIDFVDVRRYNIANIIYDFKRSLALSKINNFITDNQIVCCGRYARWDYSLIDEVITSTEKVVSKLL